MNLGSSCDPLAVVRVKGNQIHKALLIRIILKPMMLLMRGFGQSTPHSHLPRPALAVGMSANCHIHFDNILDATFAGCVV